MELDAATRRVSIGFTTVAWCIAIAACGPRPIELGFWLEPLTFASPRLGEPISQAEYAVIDKVARAEIARAFEDFDVTVPAIRNARYRVVVVPHLKDNRLKRSGTYAGESRAVAGFGGSGAVSFEYVANGASVFAPDEASRAAIVESIGRGVGRVAIHEFLHQLLPTFAIHDSKDRESYEGNSPALIEGYFGDLHWDIARPAIERRIKRREGGRQP